MRGGIELGDARRRSPSRPIPANELALVDPNAAPLPQDLCDEVVHSPGTLRSGEDVNVIMVGHHKVSRRQPLLDFSEGWAEGDAEEPRHEGITLLASLSAIHAV